MDFEEWKKHKINGKITKIKHFEKFIQLFIFNKIQKKSDLVFVFDEDVKNYIMGIDLNKHYSFYCVDRISKKNNKVYNELKSRENVHQMSPYELHLANIFYLSSKIKKEHRGTWHEDMIRVDKIYSECENAVKCFLAGKTEAELTKINNDIEVYGKSMPTVAEGKKYWDDKDDELTTF
jgi:hypothetical protein